MDTVISEKVKELIDGLAQKQLNEADCLAKVKALNLPVIEEREGYSKFVWVTHFYIGQQNLENVVLYEPHISFNPERALMDRLPGTNIFWKTTLVPYTFPLKYAFSVNDSLDANCERRVKQLTLDPLNPRICNHDSANLSFVQMPTKSVI